MTSLLILAYNEDKTIKNLLHKLYHNFEYVILIDDNSSDNTKNECKEYFKKNNFIYFKNDKNLGAGKSFELGLKTFNKLKSNYLVKIDGDNQFEINDILYLSKYGENNEFDFIKCDRFWKGGIQGKIPFIRYFGNTLASLLIKISTGNWKFNDPLNGLFFISKKVSMNFNITKLFSRYGYPFYLVNYVSALSKVVNLKIGQYKNIVSYGDEKSQLKANTMFIKLIYFTIKSFYKKIKIKFRFSELQFSALADLMAQLSFILILFSIFNFYSIGNNNEFAPRSSWILVIIFEFLIFTLLLFISQKIENSVESNNLNLIVNNKSE